MIYLAYIFGAIAVCICVFILYSLICRRHKYIACKIDSTGIRGWSGTWLLTVNYRYHGVIALNETDTLGIKFHDYRAFNEGDVIWVYKSFGEWHVKDSKLMCMIILAIIFATFAQLVS